VERKGNEGKEREREEIRNMSGKKRLQGNNVVYVVNKGVYINIRRNLGPFRIKTKEAQRR
jgi:hypothetical protein